MSGVLNARAIYVPLWIQAGYSAELRLLGDSLPELTVKVAPTGSAATEIEATDGVITLPADLVTAVATAGGGWWSLHDPTGRPWVVGPVEATAEGTPAQNTELTVTVGVAELTISVTGGAGVPLSDTPAEPLGPAGPGESTAAARADHVHPMPTAAQVGALPDDTVIPDASALVANDDSRLSDARTPDVGGSNDDFMQRKSGAWTNRTVAQVKADLDIGVARLVVAASDASSRAKARADYVCDGTDDDETIETAVAALPSAGGVVELSEGTFHVNPVTLVAPSGGPRSAGGVTLVGQGDATVLRLQDQAASSLPSKHGVIQATGTSEALVAGIKIRHLAVDGNRSNISGDHGLDMEGINLVYCVEPVVFDVSVRDAIESGIDFDGSVRGLVLGNRLSGCGGWGIHMSHGATDNRIIANNVDGCSVEFERGGIDQWGNSPGGNRNVYVGNRVNNSRKNYQIRGAEAVFIGNSSDNGTVADEFTANLTSLGTIAGLDLTPSTPQWSTGDEGDDIDLSLPFQQFTLTGNWSPDVTGVPSAPDAAVCTIAVVNDGNHTVTWPSDILWPSTPPTLTEDETLVVRLTHVPSLGAVAEVVGSLGNPEPSVPLLVDDFTRSNGSLGSVPSGSLAPVAWGTPSGTWAIVSNRAAVTSPAAGTNTHVLAFVDTGVSDMAVEWTATTWSVDTYLPFRVAAAGEFLAVRANASGHLGIYSRSGGAWTAVTAFADVGGAPGSADVIRVEAVGSSITVKRNGSTILTGTTSTHESETGAGLGGYTDALGSVTAARWSMFAVESLA